jgi:hypothetical protein
MLSPDENIEAIRDALFEPLGVITLPDPGEFLGPAVEQFEELALALACVHLFEKGSRVGYERNLGVCGFARRLALRHFAASAPRDPIYSAASRAQGELACFIAGDDATVAEIIRRSSPVHCPDGEYAEDFHYRKILHHLMVSEALRVDELRERVRMFDAARTRVERERGALCAAFLDDDEDGFFDAFDTLHDELVASSATPPLTDDPWPEIIARLWLEGLVWLDRAAVLRGWRPASHRFTLCPGWAWRTGPRVHPLEDIFASVAVGPAYEGT